MRPNILILTSDEHAPQMMGCMNDPIARTPNMDRLAARGALFKNAYCNNPVCVPGRYSTMTGKFCRDIGSLHYGDGLDPKTWTYPKHFAREGYQTTCVGKMHFMGVEQMHGWMFRPYGDMELVDAHDKMPGFNKDPYEHINKTRVSMQEWIQDAGPGMGGFIPFDESTTREACIHLRDYFDTVMVPIYNQERPLLYQVSWKTPHWPFYCPKELFDYYRPLVELPKIPPPEKTTAHPSLHANLNIKASNEEVLNARAAYYGLIEYVDKQIGIVLDTLEELGVLDDFMIVYQSDHGELAGNHGQWGKGSALEHSSRTPLLISYPPEIPSDTIIEENVSLVDMFPTMCDYANIDSPPEMRGDSLKPLINKTNDQTFSNRPIFSEHNNGRFSWIMVKRDNIKLIRYSENNMSPQLFDLKTDPNELKNIYKNPKYTDIQNQLNEDLDSLPTPFKWNENADHLTPEAYL